MGDYTNMLLKKEKNSEQAHPGRQGKPHLATWPHVGHTRSRTKAVGCVMLGPHDKNLPEFLMLSDIFKRIVLY